ncbi:MAG: hypothetical protein RSB25_19665 [Acinetobacter sp.]
MPDDKAKQIEAIKEGHLPPLQSTSNPSGLSESQRDNQNGLNYINYGLNAEIAESHDKPGNEKK